VKETEVFVLADRALQSVVDRIGDDQWSLEMPASFATRAPGPITLREVIGYHAYDDAWVPDMLAGRTMDEVGADTHKGDLLGDDPKAAFAAIVDTAVAAAEGFDDLERTVHCSFGDFSAKDYLAQITSFRGLRAHDLAHVIGTDPTLPPELVQGLWDMLGPVADEWRTYGVFGDAVPVADDAPLIDRLIGLTGRDPYVE
jgi:uncharacterized protein (TIGR03086 family)